MSELGNGLTRIFLAGVGALAVTAEKSKEVVDELVKKGELTVERGRFSTRSSSGTLQRKSRKLSQIFSLQNRWKRLWAV